MIEIERKFLVNRLPGDLSMYHKKELMQGYISTEPVLRLRRSDDDYIFTFKNAGPLAIEKALKNKAPVETEEFESSLTKEQFDKLWSLVSGNEIIKSRYYIPLDGGLVAETDVYRGRLKGLLIVEVEFDTVSEAKTFIPPDWFGEDVTGDKRYSNAGLSQSLPPDLTHIFS